MPVDDFCSAYDLLVLHTGAEDETAVSRNRQSWQAIRLRPRVLRPIRKIDTSRQILGTTFSLPFFICPAGGAKLCHPEGDVLLTRAAGHNGILHWVCNNAGRSQEEIANVRKQDQTLYWQIYAMNDLKHTKMEIERAIKLGYKGFALTVDAIRPGKREQDMRGRLAEEVYTDEKDGVEESFARQPTVTRPFVSLPVMGSNKADHARHVYSEFDWQSATHWLRRITDLPIAIKGIQSWEDAELCMQHGVHPWLSNHGGRQLDSGPSSVDTLIDIRRHCPEVLQRCEVIVDGGITRGSDVIKAIALGATAVGVGRGFLYSMVFGEIGVNRAIRMLRHELETTMALLGINSLDELSPQYVGPSHL